MKISRSLGGLVILSVASLSYAQDREKDKSATITKVVSGVSVYKVAENPTPKKEDSNPGSLWGSSTRTPYDEPTQQTIKKHDLIQIVVNEKGDANASANLKTDKRSRWEWNINDFLRFENSSGAPRLQAGKEGDDKINVDARFRQDNAGATKRQFSLSFTITAEVIDILPNGVLMLEAKKARKVNDETETIRLTGKVDQKKVTDNKISSDDIADLMIDYLGKGSVDNATHPGVLGWVLQMLWPF